MFVIGLTGGIATGKSTVSTVLKQLGAFIIDADKIAREVVEPGMPALEIIKEKFGDKVLNLDGTINRAKLAQVVFDCRDKLNLLNSIMHPYIIEAIRSRLETARRNAEKVVVIDAALLIETGLYHLTDVVWVAVTDERTQIRRLLNRESNLSREAAQKRVLAQMPLKTKLLYADKIIDNSGRLESTIETVKNLWRDIPVKWV